MTDAIEDLIELPRRVVPQPTPELHAGGDCGACVLAGISDLPLEEVYARLHPKGKAESFNRRDMYEALRVLKWELKRISHFVYRMPRWSVDDMLAAWGDTGWLQSMEWMDYLRVAFAGGYYAITSTVIKPSDGPLPKAGGTNHWNLLCGLRTEWKTAETGKFGEFQVLVSCSARSTPDLEWVEVGEFLQKRGGFAVMLAKPVAP